MAATQTPRRPYLVRAMHEWMTANNQTPHLVVDAAAPQPQRFPGAFVRDGRITLNVSWQATQGLKLGNEWIEFSARFGGVSQHVRVPVASVLGIYARETGQGMLFQDEGEAPPPAAGAGDSRQPAEAARHQVSQGAFVASASGIRRFGGRPLAACEEPEMPSARGHPATSPRGAQKG